MPVQLGLTVTGDLDTERLRNAVQNDRPPASNVVAHFCEQFGEPVQVIPANPETGLAVVDLRRRADAEA